MVYSSELGGFQQWFDCFRILFDVDSVPLMEEFENLIAMINIEIGEIEEFFMADQTYKTNRWINALHSKNNRKLSHNVPVYNIT